MTETELTHTPEYQQGYVKGWDANHCNYPLELLEIAWGIIANAGQGDWDKEDMGWVGAAIKFREQYFKLLDDVGRD